MMTVKKLKVMDNNKVVVATDMHTCMGERETYSPRAHSLVGFCLTKWPTLGDTFGYL